MRSGKSGQADWPSEQLAAFRNVNSGLFKFRH
jgi:hypothetical protein